MIEVNEAIPAPEAQPIPVIPEFFPDRATLILSIAKNKLDLEAKRAVADTYNLLQKPEFHLTVLGTDTGRQLLEHFSQSPQSEREQALTQIESLANQTKWKVFLRPEYFFIQKTYPLPADQTRDQQLEPEVRSSIVQTAEVSELAEFYDTINRLFDQHFPVPYPHITLFTVSTNPKNNTRGIGIYSLEDLQALQPKQV